MKETGELARRLIEAMQGGVGGTTSELAVLAQADVRNVRALLRTWVDAEIVHVAEVIAPRRTLVYRYGKAPAGAAEAVAVRKPRPRAIVEVQFDRWPQLDPEVAAAVDAMVRTRSRES
jgi:hypothetical protein